MNGISESIVKLRELTAKLQPFEKLVRQVREDGVIIEELLATDACTVHRRFIPKGQGVGLHKHEGVSHSIVISGDFQTIKVVNGEEITLKLVAGDVVTYSREMPHKVLALSDLWGLNIIIPGEKAHLHG